MDAELDTMAAAVAIFRATMAGDREGQAAIVAGMPDGDSGPLLDALCAWLANLLDKAGLDPDEVAQRQLQALMEAS